MDAFTFTKTRLHALPLPPKGERVSYRDARQPGLTLRITHTGVKSFVVYHRVRNKPVRVTLGRFPTMTIEQAHKQAAITLARIAGGINPNALKRAKQVKQVTLDEVFADYLRARKSLKPRTRQDYQDIMRQAFSDWRTRPLAAISRDMVARRHTELGERSQARANNAMRVLRALFNFASGEYEDENGRSLFPDNPVRRLSHAKAWYRVPTRATVIKAHELRAWYEAVQSLTASSHEQFAFTVRDYLLLTLFTGLRREEAACLKWEDIDLIGRTLTIDDTKNHERHVLPLSTALENILKARRAVRFNEYVFGSSSGATGHLVNPSNLIQKVRAESGVRFTIHDLRRTFITIADSLDISLYTIKRLANHKLTGDVTAGYIILNVERLRKPMQQIADFIMNTVERDDSQSVVQLAAKN